MLLKFYAAFKSIIFWVFLFELWYLVSLERLLQLRGFFVCLICIKTAAIINCGFTVWTSAQDWVGQVWSIEISSMFSIKAQHIFYFRRDVFAIRIVWQYSFQNFYHSFGFPLYFLSNLLRVKDLLQTCSKTWKYSALNNNLCLIWSSHKKRDLSTCANNQKLTLWDVKGHICKFH